MASVAFSVAIRVVRNFQSLLLSSYVDCRCHSLFCWSWFSHLVHGVASGFSIFTERDNHRYLAGKLHLFDKRGHTGKAWIAFTPLVGALLVAISRTMDNRRTSPLFIFLLRILYKCDLQTIGTMSLLGASSDLFYHTSHTGNTTHRSSRPTHTARTRPG